MASIDLLRVQKISFLSRYEKDRENFYGILFASTLEHEKQELERKMKARGDTDHDDSDEHEEDDWSHRQKTKKPITAQDDEEDDQPADEPTAAGNDRRYTISPEDMKKFLATFDEKIKTVVEERKAVRQRLQEMEKKSGRKKRTKKGKNDPNKIHLESPEADPYAGLVTRGQGEKGETALHSAAAAGMGSAEAVKIVKMLLLFHADPNVRAKGSVSLSYPPLLWHVHSGLDGAVEALLAGGADPNLVVFQGGFEPSEAAAKKHGKKFKATERYETALDVASAMYRRSPDDDRIQHIIRALKAHGGKTFKQLLKEKKSKDGVREGLLGRMPEENNDPEADDADMFVNQKDYTQAPDFGGHGDEL